MPARSQMLPEVCYTPTGGIKKEEYLEELWCFSHYSGHLLCLNLGQTLGAPPVSFRDVMERRDQAEGVVAVITAVA